MTRKDFLSTTGLATASLIVPFPSLAKPKSTTQDRAKICVFSKQLQWLNYKDMAKAVAAMGYDGIDLTVRTNGHVLPERVGQDLPAAVSEARKAGIDVLLISTEIQDEHTPFAEAILKTASGLGIQYYRSGGLNYPKETAIETGLEQISAKFKSLQSLNRRYNLHGDYLNHSGENFGASLWDLWFALRELNPAYVGSQYDVKHATVDGPLSWPTTLKLLHPYVKTVCVRDFRFVKKEETWDVQPVPLGEGMVDFKKFFSLAKQYGINGPFTVMCDYELGGAQNGERKLSVPPTDVLQAMKKDLTTLRNYLDKAGI